MWLKEICYMLLYVPHPHLQLEPPVGPHSLDHGPVFIPRFIPLICEGLLSHHSLFSYFTS